MRPSDEDGWSEDGEVVLARTVGADGRSGARIGGQIATAGALGALGGRLVEVHGQHQSLRLLEAATQTAFLDRLAGRGASRRRDGAAARRSPRGARPRPSSDALREADRDREREIDLLTLPGPRDRGGRPARGRVRRRSRPRSSALGHVERLQELSADGRRGARRGRGRGGRPAWRRRLARARRRGRHSTPRPTRWPSGRPASRPRRASSPATSGRTRAGLAADPERLAGAAERRRPPCGACNASTAPTTARWSRSSRRGEDALATRSTGADERPTELATRRSRARGGGVPRGRRGGLRGTRGGGARCLRPPSPPRSGSSGCPRPTSRSTSPRPSPGPPASSVPSLRLSGGGGPALAPARARPRAAGSSRASCSRAAASRPTSTRCRTLVFDEVDAGIGGQAGLAVGARLARLAAARQVVVVTHLPQIACFADRHVRVRKEGGARLGRGPGRRRAARGALPDARRARGVRRTASRTPTSCSPRRAALRTPVSA